MSDTPKGNGRGCECGACCSSQCACPDADWTPQAVYDLLAQLDLANFLADGRMALLHGQEARHSKQIEELASQVKNSWNDLENAIAQRDAYKKDYDEARERHWETLQGVRDAQEKLRAELSMLRNSNPSPDWKAAIDAVSNILP